MASVVEKNNVDFNTQSEEKILNLLDFFQRKYNGYHPRGPMLLLMTDNQMNCKVNFLFFYFRIN